MIRDNLAAAQARAEAEARRADQAEKELKESRSGRMEHNKTLKPINVKRLLYWCLFWVPVINIVIKFGFARPESFSPSGISLVFIGLMGFLLTLWFNYTDKKTGKGYWPTSFRAIFIGCWIFWDQLIHYISSLIF